MDDTDSSKMTPAELRPLFEEPNDAFQRENPWSGPLAFVLGGMALPTFAELADEYFRAARLLVDAILRGDCEDYLLPNPVLFLYRHAIELRLKWLMGESKKTHDLDRLLRDIASAPPAGFGAALPGWLKFRLAELAAVDPCSTSFRYAQTRDRITRPEAPVDGEIFVDLRHLMKIMELMDVTLRQLAVSTPS